MPLKILILAVLVLLVFGKGKFSDMMGDVAKGIQSFRKGLADDDHDDVAAAKPAPALQAPQQGSINADASRKDNA